MKLLENQDLRFGKSKKLKYKKSNPNLLYSEYKQKIILALRSNPFGIFLQII